MRDTPLRDPSRAFFLLPQIISGARHVKSASGTKSACKSEFGIIDTDLMVRRSAFLILAADVSATDRAKIVDFLSGRLLQRVA